MRVKPTELAADNQTPLTSCIVISSQVPLPYLILPPLPLSPIQLNSIQHSHVNPHHPPPSPYKLSTWYSYPAAVPLSPVQHMSYPIHTY